MEEREGEAKGERKEGTRLGLDPPERPNPATGLLE